MIQNTDDFGIQKWANLQQIPLELVNQGRITLNHGELAFDALTVKIKKAPMLLLTRENESHLVDLGRF